MSDRSTLKEKIERGIEVLPEISCVNGPWRAEIMGQASSPWIAIFFRGNLNRLIDCQGLSIAEIRRRMMTHTM